ncbi:MAG: GTP pyrophosphokinase [Raoultibacter sp.]|jgi:putative GTP pyrophosphokinase
MTESQGMELDKNLSIENIKRMRALERMARDVLQKYHAAMRQMEVRLEILDQDLKLTNQRSPVHHIESRLKNPASIFEKLDRYGKKATIEDMTEYILDIAGLRVICSYISDVYNIFDSLEKQDDLTIVNVKDYIANPKENGYRSLHIIAKIPVHFLNEREEIPVEIQLRTVAMDFWASLEHDLKYKALREIKGIDSYDELRECSKIIEGVEDRMQILARALEQE